MTTKVNKKGAAAAAPKASTKTSFRAKYNKDLVRKKILGFLAMFFRYALLISLGFVILTPVYTVLKESITAQEALGSKSMTWVPTDVSIQTMMEAWLILDYPKSLAYSILNAAILAILQTACASFAAYSFARLKFKGSGLLFGLVVFTIIVPPQSMMLAQYISLQSFDIFGLIKAITGSPLNLIGSTWASYLLAATGMGVKGGLFVYILRQSYRQLPVSIEEAAYVDGAGFLKTFFRIVLPGVSSTLLTVGVLSFVWNYADVYYSSLLNSTSKNLSLNLKYVQAQIRWAIQGIENKMPQGYIVSWDSPMVQTAVASACALLVILPLLIGYIFIQKRFVQGVERSGLGGE